MNLASTPISGAFPSETGNPNFARVAGVDGGTEADVGGTEADVDVEGTEADVEGAETEVDVEGTGADVEEAILNRPPGTTPSSSLPSSLSITRHCRHNGPHVTGRAQIGRISIANSDASAYAYVDGAIDAAVRAVDEQIKI